VYTYSPLLFEFRHSNLIIITFITLIYGGGMPLLYVVSAVSLFVQYWVDKITMLYIYQNPPRLNLKLMQMTRSWMMPGVIFHILFSFYMYTNSTIFETQNSMLFGWSIGSVSEQWQQGLKWINFGD
jgi:hypothetical protein